MIGIYGLAANATKYSILWSDVSGSVSSCPIFWDNLAPLERYVHSLCLSHDDHRIWDPIVNSPTLCASKGTTDEPRWTIVRPKGACENCSQLHTAEGWDRKTTVYMYSWNSTHVQTTKQG